MKNIWRKMRDCWLDFWEDDELDMDKKHLSQHDKRSLLYGGFMIEVATFGLFSIGIIAGNIWTNHQNQKDKNIQCLSPAKMSPAKPAMPFSQKFEKMFDLYYDESNAIQLDVRENVRFVIEFFQKYQKSYL